MSLVPMDDNAWFWDQLTEAVGAAGHPDAAINSQLFATDRGAVLILGYAQPGACALAVPELFPRVAMRPWLDKAVAKWARHVEYLRARSGSDTH